MTKYQTRDGDMLDDICYRHYGTSRDTVEQVLAANPGLSANGPILPSGIAIILPNISVKKESEVIRLWD